MTRTLPPLDDDSRGASVPAGRHRAREDHTILDFPWGDYGQASYAASADPARPDRPYVPGPAPLAASAAAYRPQVQTGYAVVLYATAVGRVDAVIAPFADALSAEEYALDSRFTSYDVVPATAVSRTAS